MAERSAFTTKSTTRPNPTGEPAVCSGTRQLAQVRAYAPNKTAERKMLYENARKLFRF